METRNANQHGDSVRVRVEYRDAAGNWHATFALERDDGRRVRGEAVHDPRLARTLLDEGLPGLFPADVRLIKRAVATACAQHAADQAADSKDAPSDTGGMNQNG